jgi:hypothetical protein
VSSNATELQISKPSQGMPPRRKDGQRPPPATRPTSAEPPMQSPKKQGTTDKQPADYRLPPAVMSPLTESPLPAAAQQAYPAYNKHEDERTTYAGPLRSMHSATFTEPPSAAAAQQPGIASPTGMDDRVGLGIAFEQLDACPEAGLPLSNLIVCGIADGSPAAQSGGIEVRSIATTLSCLSWPACVRIVPFFLGDSPILRA